MKRSTRQRSKEAGSSTPLNVAESDDDDDNVRSATLVSGGKEPYTCTVTRQRLRSKSDYFKGLFSSGMKEASEEIISLTAIPADVLQMVTDYIKHGAIHLDMDILQDVLSAAVYLQVKDLIKHCTEYIEQNMTAANVKMIIGLAEELSLEDIKEIAHGYVLNNLMEFTHTDDFKHLDIEEICSLLDNDNLNVKDEADVFHVVLRWLHLNERKDASVCEKLLEAVRYPLISPVDLTKCINILKTEGLSQACTKFIKDSSQFLKMSANSKQYAQLLHAGISTKKTRARCEIESFITCGGFTGSESATNKFQMLPVNLLLTKDGSLSAGTQFKNIKECRLRSKLCEHCTCVVDNVLYVVGGQTQYCQDGRYTVNYVHRFDPRFARWQEVCSMGTPRSLFYLGVLHGAMYAVSGWRAPNTVTRTVERYIPAEDRWEYLPNLEVGLHEHAGCIHEDTIYVSGGYKGPFRGHLSQVFSYNTHSNNWTERAPMTHARSYHAMTSINGKLLVVGGVNYIGDDNFEDVMECEVYDSKCNQWSIACRLPLFASCMPFHVLGNTLFLFGGHSFAKNEDHTLIQAFDADNNTWSQQVMNTNRILCFTIERLKVPKKYIENLK